MSIHDKRKDKVHTRSISLSTYDAEENCIIVEGKLIDHRLKDVYHFSGEKKPPGVIHHMLIRMLVSLPALTIKDIEVEMPAVPREECLETMKNVREMIGVSITSGYSECVKKRVGGKVGCAHLSTLLISMGPEVVQGAYANHARKPQENTGNELRELFIAGMKNTCYVWRENGTHYKTVIDSLKNDG